MRAVTTRINYLYYCNRYICNIIRKCQELLGVVRDRTDLARRMRADDRDMNPDNFLRLKGVPMVYDLINEIADAFCNHSAVLSAFSVLDPGNLPDSVTEIAEYGKAKRR
ncbi:uncharacterized protein LOC132743680 [Ruditapes philippinarum]|uniref:uncharacterized protein LOC132743680 n=1 Tax=Ruditapes philippinarum TaxID=129788 RepID=UPI00295C3983|nr:uncharacterized protein LOC132743680 [Ruditapes philippinarum]